MKVLVVGASGMLGHKVCEVFAREPRFEVHGTVRAPARDAPWFVGVELHPGVDAVRFDTIEGAMEHIRPELVVNCIGVIKQSSQLDDSAATVEINAVLPHRLAARSRRLGARFIHVSTDCVFSGSRGNYMEADLEDARDLYGRSKLLGEVGGENAITLRTSIIGRALSGAAGLIEWFLSQRGKTVRGYQKAIFSGVTTETLAHVMRDVVVPRPELSGLYHVSAAAINKEDLLRRYAKEAKLDIEIVPETSFTIDRSLDSTRFRATTGWQPPAWDDMLATLAAEVDVYDRWRPTSAPSISS